MNQDFLKLKPHNKCKECGLDFIKINYNKIFCSKNCCSKYHNKRRKPDAFYLLNKKQFLDDIQLVEEMFQKLILCPKCKKPLSEYWNNGKRKTKRGEDKDRYRCLKCGYYFTLYSLDFRMQHKESDILKFIKLRKEGFNPNQIVLKGLLKIGVMTSYRWNKKYCSLNLNKEKQK